MNSFKRWLSIKKNKNARLLLLLSIVGFNILLWLLSSLLAYILSPGSYGSVVNALWKSGITWMLEPGFFDPEVDVPIRIISLVVIITSMITFTGGIIGYVSSIFSSFIEKAESGKGKLYIYDHILILNWNTKALELIADYQYDDDITNIVILSSCEKHEIEKMIERKIYEVSGTSKFAKKINIIVKEGDVFSRSDLNDVCVEKARTIIILSPEDSNGSEMQTIKTLMLVANSDINKGQTIIIEAKKQETVNLINDKIAGGLSLKSNIIPLLPDEMMGRLIAQTILFPEINDVYKELFSFEGAEFHTTEDCDPIEYLRLHNKSIPIYSHDGKLYVLTDNEKNVFSERAVPYVNERKIRFNKILLSEEKNIVVFGDNAKLKYILNSLKLFEADSGSKVNVIHVEDNDAETINKCVRDIKKIDTILILADENTNGDYDSDVLLTLLMIRDIAKIHNADIIIELLNPKHFDIAQSYNIKNVVISNRYVSRIMTQLSKDNSLYYLFYDLLTYDEFGSGEGETYELYTYKAKDFFDELFPLCFSSPAELVNAAYHSSKGDYVIIGLIKNGVTEIFKGDLDCPIEISIEPNDLVVVINK